MFIISYIKNDDTTEGLMYFDYYRLSNPKQTDYAEIDYRRQRSIFSNK